MSCPMRKPYVAELPIDLLPLLLDKIPQDVGHRVQALGDTLEQHIHAAKV